MRYRKVRHSVLREHRVEAKIRIIAINAYVRFVASNDAASTRRLRRDFIFRTIIIASFGSMESHPRDSRCYFGNSRPLGREVNTGVSSPLLARTLFFGCIPLRSRTKGDRQRRLESLEKTTQFPTERCLRHPAVDEFVQVVRLFSRGRSLSGSSRYSFAPIASRDTRTRGYLRSEKNQKCEREGLSTKRLMIHPAYFHGRDVVHGDKLFYGYA